MGFEDETRRGRTAHPKMSAWSLDDHPLRLIEQTIPKNDSNPKALAANGLLVRTAHGLDEIWLCFVDGRPLSTLTVSLLGWCCRELEAVGQTALLLVWDNAPWHISQTVRTGIRTHNCQVKQQKKGVRILPSPLPTKSPWLNPIEPK